MKWQRGREEEGKNVEEKVAGEEKKCKEMQKLCKNK